MPGNQGSDTTIHHTLTHLILAIAFVSSDLSNTVFVQPPKEKESKAVKAAKAASSGKAKKKVWKWLSFLTDLTPDAEVVQG